MLVMTLAGIAALFFVVIYAPALLARALKKSEAKAAGVEYVPVREPVKERCPDCGVMVEEDFGFCSACGKVFVKKMNREVPVGLTVHHPRYY